MLNKIFSLLIIGILFSLLNACDSNSTGSNENINSADRLNIKAPEFSFIAHTGDTINNAFLKGDLYVADFFFTTCPSICPKMSAVVAALQDTFKAESRLKFVSFTIDPKRDTIEALKRYAQKFKANPSRWYFLETEQNAVYDLMETGFMLSGAYNGGESDNITHSDRLILVDTKGAIVGYYEALDPKLVSDLISKIRLLLQEL